MKIKPLAPIGALAALAGAWAWPAVQAAYVKPKDILGGTSGRILQDNGSTGVWNAVSGDASISGSGSVAVSKINGNSVPSGVATGDLLYGSGANTLSRLAAGTASQVLTTVSGLPVWANVTTVPAAGTSGQMLYDNGTSWTASGSAINWNGSTLQITPASGSVAFQGNAPLGGVIALQNDSNTANTPNASRLGQINLQGFQNSTLSNGAAIEAVASSAWSAGSSPGDLVFMTTPSASTTVTPRGRFTAAGSFYTGNGTALSTNATSGQIRVQTCAGVPTGTPEGGTGSMVYDTIDSRWYGWNGSSWVNLTGSNNAVAYDVLKSGTGPISVAATSHKIYIWNGSPSTGTYNLPAASSAVQGWVQVFRSQSGAMSIVPNGTDNINGSNSALSITASHSATLVCDGTGWWEIASF